MPSWNQIKTQLLKLSQAHAQVNSFGCGDPLSIGTDNTTNLKQPTKDRISYPLVFVDLESASTLATSRTLSVAVYFMDRVEDLRNKDADPARYWKDNEDEVISDMLEVATDYISFFQDDPEFNYTLNSSVGMTRFLEARDDKVAGWRAVFNFEMPFSRSVCIIPD
jgi:hypothetical protein